MASSSDSIRLRYAFLLLTALVMLMALYGTATAQVENVPVYHPVYQFLKRMETKGGIGRYHDAILPLSRREVGEFLSVIRDNPNQLTSVEQGMLDDFSVEFQYELTGSTAEMFSGLNLGEHSVGAAVDELFSDREKFLYAYSDSALNFFVNGLLTFDVRRSRGDALRGENAQFLQAGGRIRGTIGGHLGYYLQVTNAQFWGSRNVLRRDKFISQAYTLNVGDAQNFDFAEGYMRYEYGIVSAQVGRERLLWGNGYGDRLIVSDNPRVFDFIRLDAQYKALKYTFMHAWITGSRSNLVFALPSDTTAKFFEPVAADKYLAAHRFEISPGPSLDLGFQEMAIYSNRSPDLAYLNPVMIIESAQRSREERDNVLWAFDVQWRPFRNWEVQGTIDFDDLNFKKWGTNDVQNKQAWQVGLRTVDPLGLPDITLMGEYTRIEPYMFTHSRSRDNNYTSYPFSLTHHTGPNSESWFFQLDKNWLRNLRTAVSFERVNHGANIVAPNGKLLVNVGGDILQPRRASDPSQKEFLGGDLQKTSAAAFTLTWEVFNEFYLDARYLYERRSSSLYGTTRENHDFGAAIRIDY